MVAGPNLFFLAACQLNIRVEIKKQINNLLCIFSISIFMAEVRKLTHYRSWVDYTAIFTISI
jgi:hypothetical protein